MYKLCRLFSTLSRHYCHGFDNVTIYLNFYNPIVSILTLCGLWQDLSIRVFAKTRDGRIETTWLYKNTALPKTNEMSKLWYSECSLYRHDSTQDVRKSMSTVLQQKWHLKHGEVVGLCSTKDVTKRSRIAWKRSAKDDRASYVQHVHFDSRL